MRYTTWSRTPPDARSADRSSGLARYAVTAKSTQPASKVCATSASQRSTRSSLRRLREHTAPTARARPRVSTPFVQATARRNEAFGFIDSANRREHQRSGRQYLTSHAPEGMARCPEAPSHMLPPGHRLGEGLSFGWHRRSEARVPRSSAVPPPPLAAFRPKHRPTAADQPTPRLSSHGRRALLNRIGAQLPGWRGVGRQRVLRRSERRALRPNRGLLRTSSVRTHHRPDPRVRELACCFRAQSLTRSESQPRAADPPCEPDPSRRWIPPTPRAR